jgi:hypothetical protein
MTARGIRAVRVALAKLPHRLAYLEQRRSQYDRRAASPLRPTCGRARDRRRARPRVVTPPQPGTERVVLTSTAGLCDRSPARIAISPQHRRAFSTRALSRLPVAPENRPGALDDDAIAALPVAPSDAGSLGRSCSAVIRRAVGHCGDLSRCATAGCAAGGRRGASRRGSIHVAAPSYATNAASDRSSPRGVEQWRGLRSRRRPQGAVVPALRDSAQLPPCSSRRQRGSMLDDAVGSRRGDARRGVDVKGEGEARDGPRVAWFCDSSTKREGHRGIGDSCARAVG